MASWVLSIDKDHPQHWDYAVSHGMWDLRSERSIRSGGTLLFWQSGTKGGWVGRARATQDAYHIDVDNVAPGPWDDWPGKPRYRARFAMHVMDATATIDVSGSQVCTDLGVAINPGWIYPFSPHQEEVLASYFAETEGDAEPVDPDYSDRERKRDLEKFGFALRRYSMRAIAITGTSAEEVLEAAHISSFSGRQSNETHNGLLLRADIHTLFDRLLITVLPDHTVRISPKLKDTDYTDLDGHQLVQVPASSASAPDHDLLRRHNAACNWLRLAAPPHH